MLDDKFENFESTISGWIARHKIITFILVGIFIAVLICSLFLVLCTSYIGANYAWGKVTDLHNAKNISEEQYTNWNNVVIPTLAFSLNFTIGFGASLLIVYIIAMIYFIIRWGYRRTKNMRSQENAKRIELLLPQPCYHCKLLMRRSEILNGNYSTALIKIQTEQSTCTGVVLMHKACKIEHINHARLQWRKTEC